MCLGYINTKFGLCSKHMNKMVTNYIVHVRCKLQILFKKKFNISLTNNYLIILVLITFKNGDSTSKYLETTYKQNKCLSIPFPHIASW